VVNLIIIPEYLLLRLPWRANPSHALNSESNAEYIRDVDSLIASSVDNRQLNQILYESVSLPKANRISRKAPRRKLSGSRAIDSIQ
jgi:hypothetical protein